MPMARFPVTRWHILFLAALACSHPRNMVAQSSNALSCLAYISDTQAPLWIEGVYRGRHDNEKATRLLLDDLVNRDPVQAFMLGDVVNMGYRENRWTVVDSALAKLRGQ